MLALLPGAVQGSIAEGQSRLSSTFVTRRRSPHLAEAGSGLN